MPSKDKTKSTTLAAVEASTQALAKSAVAMTAAESRFEADPSPANWAAAQEARAEHTYQTRVNDLAVAAHVAAEQAEAERVAAEAEQQRLADLAAVNYEIEQNIQSSSRAGEILARGLAVGWNLAVKQQGLGGSGHNAWGYSVQNAIGQALSAEGINARLIRVT